MKEESVNKLINNKEWTKILQFLQSGALDQQHIVSDRTILQIATASNESDIIKYILKKDPLQLIKMKDSQTCIHIMASNGYTDTLKMCLLENPDFINVVDQNNNTVLHILYYNTDFLQWVLDKLVVNGGVAVVDVNRVNNSMQTVLTKNIQHAKKQTDKYYENIKILLKFNPDLGVPKVTPPLIYALYLKKEFVAKLLIDSGADINIKSSNYLTPLLVATYHDLNDSIKYILQQANAKVDYAGAEGEQNPLNLAISKKKYKFAKKLIDKQFNVNNYDRNIETSLHFSFKDHKNIPADVVSRLLYYGDLNMQNTEGDTPLHYFFKNYNWKNYNKILENKQLDVFVRNNSGKTPYDYIRPADMSSFLDMVANSYINQAQTKIGANIEAEVKRIVKEYMFKNKRSFPAKKDNQILNKQLHFIESEYSQHGLFNSDIVHNMIYTVIILKKYPHVGIPYQNFIYDKVFNDKMLQTHNDLFRTPEEVIIADLVKTYTDTFYEIAPYLIIWRSASQYYVNKDLKFYLQKCLTDNRIRLIFCKLTLVASSQGTHANIIIFDKKTGTLERFEPYGYVPYLDSANLDKFLESKFCSYLKQYLNKNKLTLKYIDPKLLFGNVGFQTISSDTEATVRKLGDPAGYCLAWTFWYLEMRLSNPDLTPRELIKQAVSVIINKYHNNGFLVFIRNYESKLYNIKNKFLINAG